MRELGRGGRGGVWGVRGVVGGGVTTKSGCKKTKNKNITT